MNGRFPTGGHFLLTLHLRKAFFSSFAFIIFVVFPLLGGCGFHPLQARSGAVDLASILVTVDTTRHGQLLEAAITDAINPDHRQQSKQYQLSITISQTEVRLFINPDGTSARSDIPLASTYTLKRLADQEIIDSGTITRVSSYNTSQSADYASYVSIQDARKRAILELAQSYKLRLANMMAKSRVSS